MLPHSPTPFHNRMFVKSEKWRPMQKYICTYTNKQVNLRMKTRYAMTPEKLKDIIARRGKVLKSS